MNNENLTKQFIHELIQEAHEKKNDILELFRIERALREIGHVALIDVIKLLSSDNTNIRNISKDILLDWIIHNPKPHWIQTLSAPQKMMMADYLIVLLLEDDDDISDIAEQGLFMMGDVGLSHICEFFSILYDDEDTLTEGNKVLAIQIAVLLKKWRVCEREAYAQWVTALSQEHIDTLLAELPEMTRIINVHNKDYSILEELGEILLLRGYKEDDIKQYGVRGTESDLDLKASFEGLTRQQRFSAINVLIAKLSDPFNNTAPKTTLIQLENIALYNVLMALHHHDKTIVSESTEILQHWRSKKGGQYGQWLKQMHEEEKEHIILLLDTLKETVSEEDISLEIHSVFDIITDPYDLFPLSEHMLGPGVLFSIIAFFLCISDDDDLVYIEKYMNYLEQNDNSTLAEDVIFMNEFFTSIHLSHDMNLIKFVYILLRSIVRRGMSLSDYLETIQETVVG